MADESAKDTTKRIYCNACRQMTHHELLCKVDDVVSEYYEEGGVVDFTTTFETFRCCGCREAVLRRTVIAGNDPDTVYRQYFPPMMSRHRPPWLFRASLPTDSRAVIHEIYRSLDSDNHRLPMMGARTLIDMLMVDNVGDVGTFNEKLGKLVGLGVISSRNREVLAAALDVGNAAAHRGHAPNLDEVNAVMDIVENLLHAVYVLPKMAEDLKKTTPPRPSKKPTP